MSDLIQYAIPGFVVLLVAEIIVAAVQQRDYYDARDTAGSLAMGIGNVLIGFVGKALVFGTYSLIYRFRLVTVDMTQWWAWVLLFFADDFSYYRIGGPMVSPNQSQQPLLLGLARNTPLVAEV